MRNLTALLLCIFTFTAAFAQNEGNDDISKSLKALQKLKISGYIQPQWQIGQEDASLDVGSKNENTHKSFNRIGIRRGRIKVAYTEGIASGVFQLDITEKGVGIKDAYVSIKDPFIGSNLIKAGIFAHPFGYEIGYSSSKRESPERATVFRALFPGMRDVGAMISLKAAPTSPWNILELNAGLFSGNGIKQDTDSRKDFISQIKANKNINSNISFGLGASYYLGAVYQSTSEVYTMKGNEFALNDNDNNIGKFAKREYIGFDVQLDINSAIGNTKLMTEYVFGTQPGNELSSKSPNSSTIINNNTYIRDFSGGYAMIVQSLGKTPISAVIKYDWYNPNTKVKGNDIGKNNTGIADIANNTIGLGLLWNATKQIRLQAYYEIIENEKTNQIDIYNTNRKDNLFTLRLQYKF